MGRRKNILPDIG